MTKAEIVQALYTRVGGFSKKESADIVDLVFEMMKETLGRGEKIKISGFGNFVLRDKRQRPGRNPQTGDPIKISERRVLTFKASQILKQALNAKEKEKNGGGAPHPGMSSSLNDAAQSTQSARTSNGGGGTASAGLGTSGASLNSPLAASAELPKE
jgi:integration host factor subunit alpha